MDESETVGRVGFVVFNEATIGGEPGESAFDDPASALDDESSAGAVESFDDFQTGTATRRLLAHDFHQPWARVGGIGPEMPQPTKLP